VTPVTPVAPADKAKIPDQVWVQICLWSSLEWLARCQSEFLRTLYQASIARYCTDSVLLWHATIANVNPCDAKCIFCVRPMELYSAKYLTGAMFPWDELPLLETQFCCNGAQVPLLLLLPPTWQEQRDTHDTWTPETCDTQTVMHSTTAPII